MALQGSAFGIFYACDIHALILCPTANALLVCEAVSLFIKQSVRPYVAIIFYVGDVCVIMLLCPDSKHPSCVRGRVPFAQQSAFVRCYSSGHLTG